ncbi:MAG: hypothetical protein AAF617_13925 [Bacteroidota bacterium]
MKILKIILFLVIFGFALFFTLGVFVIVKEGRIYRSLFDITMISLCFILSISCTIYHIVSLKYYTKKKPTRVISPLLQIMAIACSVFAVYVAGHEYTSLFLGAGIPLDVLITMFLVFVYGVLNFIEVLYLRKQIKQSEQASLDSEINTIGNSY